MDLPAACTRNKLESSAFLGITTTSPPPGVVTETRMLTSEPGPLVDGGMVYSVCVTNITGELTSCPANIEFPMLCIHD